MVPVQLKRPIKFDEAMLERCAYRHHQAAKRRSAKSGERSSGNVKLLTGTSARRPTPARQRTFQFVDGLLIERVCINISPNQWQFLARIRQGTVRAPYGGGVGLAPLSQTDSITLCEIRVGNTIYHKQREGLRS